MRLLAFLPLTFISGIDGFGWFVGYVAAFLAVLELGRKVHRWAVAREQEIARRVPAGAVLVPVRIR